MQAAGEPLRSAVIVGGGSSGWMTAAALTKSFGKRLEVTLVESEEIGIIGVGESTVPHLREFNRLLEIDEADFVRGTRGTKSASSISRDRKSTRLNSSHLVISYAVFCLKKKTPSCTHAS